MALDDWGQTMQQAISILKCIKRYWHNNALHPTPEASAFLAFAISEQNFAFARSSLASGAGDLGRYTSVHKEK